MPEYENLKEMTSDAKIESQILQVWALLIPKKLSNILKRHKKSFGELIDLAFHKKKVYDRKKWLSNYETGTYMNNDEKEITITDFINKS
ncbi:16549_t:CDS:2 [Funneliformis geosporum]|nr:16549_t:CDS:2 [Funneliformis geosporum]